MKIICFFFFSHKPINPDSWLDALLPLEAFFFPAGVSISIASHLPTGGDKFISTLKRVDIVHSSWENWYILNGPNPNQKPAIFSWSPSWCSSCRYAHPSFQHSWKKLKHISISYWHLPKGCRLAIHLWNMFLLNIFWVEALTWLWRTSGTEAYSTRRMPFAPLIPHWPKPKIGHVILTSTYMELIRVVCP